MSEMQLHGRSVRSECLTSVRQHLVEHWPHYLISASAVFRAWAFDGVEAVIVHLPHGLQFLLLEQGHEIVCTHMAVNTLRTDCKYMQGRQQFEPVDSFEHAEVGKEPGQDFV